VEVDHENLASGDVIDIYVRFYNGKTWSSYSDLGAITSTTNNYIDLADTAVVGSGKTFQVKVELTRATGSSAGIRDVSFRYVITPDVRWRWVLQLLTHNEDLDDNTTSPNVYRKAVEDALESNDTVDMLDVHWTLLNEALDASETGITVNDSTLFQIGDTLLIDNEKMLVTANDTLTNTLTVIRGHRNTTEATHADNTRVYNCYEVYVTRLINEVLVPRDEQDRGSAEGTQYDSVLQVEVVEA
jgi:hypothetical protein